MTGDLIEVTPLDLTKQALDISVTERAAFRNCRRRWMLETLHNLTPRVPESFALEFGTGIHAGLEAYYKSKARDRKSPKSAALKAFREWYAETDKGINEDDELLTEEKDALRQELYELLELGNQILKNYVVYAQEADETLGDILYVEGMDFTKGKNLPSPKYPYEFSRGELSATGRLRVPIVDTEGCPLVEDFVSGYPAHTSMIPHLSGRIDLLVYRNAPGVKGLWIVDHKTTASSPSDRGLDFEDQITGYCYMVWRTLGIIPRGVIFNYLVKTLPKDPRILKDGTLSAAKDQATLPHLYRQEMLKQKIMTDTGSILSDKHAECYDSLLTKGWSPYFKRFEVQRNEHELRSFEARLFEEYSDIQKVTEQPQKAYPNPSAWSCPSCKVNRICQAMEDGSDVDEIIKTGFMEAKDRKV